MPKPWEVNWKKQKKEKPTGKFKILLPKEKKILIKTPESYKRRVKQDATTSFLTGLTEGATLGLSRKAVPYLKALAKTQTALPGETFSKFLEPEKKQYEAQRKEAIKEHPLAYGSGEIASYLIPGTAPAKIGKGAAKVTAKILPKAVKAVKAAKKAKVSAKLLPKLLVGGVETGLETGATEAAKKYIETGKIQEIPDNILKGAATGAVFGAGTSGLGSLVEKIGSERLKKSVLRYGKMGMEKQNLKVLIKNDFLGTLKQTKNKIGTKLKELNNNLDDITQSSNQVVNIDKVLKETRKRLFKDKQLVTAFGKNKIDVIFKQAQRNIDQLTDTGIIEKAKEAMYEKNKETGSKFSKEYIDRIVERKLKGMVNLKTATEIKRGFGRNTAGWDMGLTPAQKTQKSIWNKIYLDLRNKISEVEPRTKDVNLAIHEIIPVKEAVGKTIARSDRNNFFTLTDWILGPGAATAGAASLGVPGIIAGPAIVAAKRLASTPKASQLIFRGGEKISRQPVRRVIARKASDTINKEKDQSQLPPWKRSW